MKRTPLRKKAKSHTQGWWQSKCDDLMQDIHKYQFNKCLVCGGKNEVGHHFITKSLSSYLRYRFLNLVPLCHSCHFKHHIQADPHISQVIVNHYGQEWFAEIEKLRRLPIKLGVYELKDIHMKFTEVLARLSAPVS